MNFAAILTAIQMLASLLPTIEQLVQQAEAIIGSANGSTKLAYVETSVNAFLATAISDAAVLSSLKTLLAPTISLIVASFNLKGLFKSAPVAAVATA